MFPVEFMSKSLNLHLISPIEGLHILFYRCWTTRL